MFVWLIFCHFTAWSLVTSKLPTVTVHFLSWTANAHALCSLIDEVLGLRHIGSFIISMHPSQAADAHRPHVASDWEGAQREKRSVVIDQKHLHYYFHSEGSNTVLSMKWPIGYCSAQVWIRFSNLSAALWTGPISNSLEKILNSELWTRYYTQYPQGTYVQKQ